MLDLYQTFPGLLYSEHRITSLRDVRYNCIAWAAGDSRRWWEPDPKRKYFWPRQAPREYSLGAYTKAYESIGYRVCQSADLEPGIEKVALFAESNGFPTHAARQLPDGKWTSKCGILEDIEHLLMVLEGTTYGKVAVILARENAEK